MAFQPIEDQTTFESLFTSFQLFSSFGSDGKPTLTSSAVIMTTTIVTNIQRPAQTPTQQVTTPDPVATRDTVTAQPTTLITQVVSTADNDPSPSEATNSASSSATGTGPSSTPATTNGPNSSKATDSPSSIATDNSGSPSSSRTKHHHPRQRVVIAGSVIGVAAALALVGFSMWWILRKRRRSLPNATRGLEEAQNIQLPVTPFDHSGPFTPLPSAKTVETGFSYPSVTNAVPSPMTRKFGVQNRVSELQRTINDIQSQRASLLTRRSSTRNDADLIRRQAERLAELEVQVERLNDLLNTPWARGLEENPPPGYEEIATDLVLVPRRDGIL